MTASPADSDPPTPNGQRILSIAPARWDFFSQLGAAVDEALHGSRLLGLILIKIHNLRAMNSELGYASSDHLLGQCGEAISEALRPCDAAVRISGSEFALILPSLTSAGQAVLAANKVNRLISKPIKVGGRRVKIRSVAGIAVAPDHGADAERLLSCAEDAICAALLSDDGLALYTDKDVKTAPISPCLEAELERSISIGEIQIHHQPKINLKTREVCGVESLARWASPTQGPVSPEVFIGVAEQSGLIVELTWLVLNVALREGHSLQRYLDRLSVAVNISAATLNRHEMCEMIEQALGIWGFPADRLTLEVTESAMMADPEASMETLRRIRSMGVRISIDDFGTGYSSLAYLKRLPVNELKIDKSFVMNMCEDPGDEKIVKSVVDLAHNFDLDVVAEGVENSKTLERLGEIGCEYAQGFHIARPMPANDCLSWIRGSAFAPAVSAPTARAVSGSTA